MRSARDYDKVVWRCVGRWLHLWLSAVTVLCVMFSGDVRGCEPYGVVIYVFHDILEAQNENYRTTEVSACVGQAYYVRVEWSAFSGGAHANEPFYIDVKEGTTVLESVGPIADANEYPMWKVIEVDEAAGMTTGTHTLTADVNRWEWSAPSTGDGTVWVVEVSDVNEDITVACVNEGITFTAHADPGGKTLGCVEWERRYRPNTIWS